MNVPTGIRNTIIRQAYGTWMEMLTAALPKEEPSLCAEIVMHCRAFQVGPGEVVLDSGEISMDIFIVASGRLEARVDAAWDAAVPIEEWSRHCLKLGDAEKRWMQKRDGFWVSQMSDSHLIGFDRESA